MRSLLKSVIPTALLSFYHFAVAYIAALNYNFPSRKLVVIGVTGTKGKTTTGELLAAILEAGGHKTAVAGTLHFKTGERDERNLKKMTMPGRFFLQKFLDDAVRSGCTHAVIEMTSEGARQFRERFIDMDALIFTNLAPEHIESHGSYAAYRDAKLSIARTLSRSKKSKRFMIANADDKEAYRFLMLKNVTPIPFRRQDGEPIRTTGTGMELSFRGVTLRTSLYGAFNAYNILGAAVAAETLGVSKDAIQKGVQSLKEVAGRMQFVNEGQPFPVVIDYAHTPDSLQAVYESFPNHFIIGILGNTGGGRDTWKRPVMGDIADTHCAHVILTNEDPYDEDPWEILLSMRRNVTKKPCELILDRRTAIARALSIARERSHPVIIITGKGTDPYIMGPNGTKKEWDDKTVATEEIRKLFKN